MVITLSDSNTAAVAAALETAQLQLGCSASRLALTLLVVTTEDGLASALEDATEAAREHPCRVVLLVIGDRRGGPALDAEVKVGEGSPSEIVTIRLAGKPAERPDCAVRPLLLPDMPVIVWWPGPITTTPAATAALRAMADRRITDAAAARQPRRELGRRADEVSPGDTDLAWTRLTGWRSLLVAALDQVSGRVSAITVEAERGNPSADLLATWLGDRFRRDVRQRVSGGPGITAVRLQTSSGEVSITRGDGQLAVFSVPGRHDRVLALKRSSTGELITEELRRLSEDVVYEQVMAAYRRRLVRTAGKRPAAKTATRPAAKKAIKKTTTKKTAKKTATKATQRSTRTRAGRTAAR